MILVLITGGKRDHHYKSGVKTFDSLVEANDWIWSFNKKNAEGKYWHYAEVILEDRLYEVDCERCWDDEFGYYEHGGIPS